MEEIIKRLEKIPNSYFAFVAGVTTYIKNNPDRQSRVLNYLRNNDNLSTSDVVKFISDQPDFYEDSVVDAKNVV